MAEEVLKQIPYREHTIDVVMTCGNVRFTVKNEKDQWWFNDMDAAQKKIDQLISATARAKTDAVKVKLPVYDKDGYSMTIVGMNRANGEAKVVDYTKPVRPYGDKNNSYSGDVYPQLPWVHELLVQRVALQTQLNEINKKLHRVEVHVSGGGFYNRRIPIEQYEPKVVKMKEEIESKLRLALTIAKTDEKEKASA